MKISNAAKTTTTARKSASSSAKSKRSPLISKTGNSESAAAQLDGVFDHTESTALEGATGDRVLEEAGINQDLRGDDLSSKSVQLTAIALHQKVNEQEEDLLNESTELTAITLHQPWASLIAAGHKQYETRDWPTNHRGPIAIHAGCKPKGKQELREHNKVLASFKDLLNEDCPYSSVIAIAELTDVILMTEEFINQQCPTELRCGDWKIGRYAFKLENIRAIAPIPAVGKQGLWKWNQEAAGFNSLKIYTTPEEIWNQSDNGNGLICAQESAQGSPTPGLNCGEEAPISSANGMNTASQSLDEDSPTVNDLAISKPWILGQVNSETEELASSQQALPASPSAMTEIDSLPKTIETVSPQSLPPSINCNPNLQSSKTLPACSTAQNDQEAANFISLESLTNFPRAGTMSNGRLSAQPTLDRPGVGKDSLLLLSPGALSGDAKKRPPGQTKLDNQLKKSGLIQDGEVVNPEFLETGYQLPVGFTNPEEQRTALELSQVQAQQPSIVLNSESSAETEPIAIEEQPWAMPSTGGLPLSHSSELSICLDLPPNIGALTKNELISMAGEQHQFISSIERKEFELALEKLYRARLTGVYLQEFKRKCQYGEFQNQLKQAGIGERSAQNYMTIAKDWEVIESKAQFVALLSEDNERPSLTINWALQAVRDEKKQLKSAAPPKDPDGWRTPNTKDQPIVDLVKKALGGQIWLDPCSGSVTNNIPCAVRYFKNDNGLAQHQTWSKTVFVNPPFSDPLPWVERCCFEIARGNVSAAIMLLKAGTISNVKTGELINKYASAICHWRGRINFLNDEGNAVKGSDFDCVFIYFGSRLDLFRQAFGGRGTIATIENHYSSVNKKFMTKGEKAEFGNVEQEQKQLAAAVGLSNGKSLLPDRRDFDRALAEKYDPHTVVDVLSSSTPTPTPAAPISQSPCQPIAEPEIFDETPLATRQFNKAKENCLNDYITAISSNLSDFSDEQIAFLAKIVNEESAKRIGF